MQGNPFVADMADLYNKSQGWAPVIRGHDVKPDPEVSRAIAAAYEALPNIDQAAFRVYHRLAHEVELQYRFAIDVMGMDITFSESDPYPNSEAMFADVRDGRLAVYGADSRHPFFTVETNNKFRAVHDLFGHAAGGYGFGPKGEENAWIHHSQMLSRGAQLALTTETRGQNSWVNFGPYSHLPVKDRPFATQKVALLPVEFTRWRFYL